MKLHFAEVIKKTFIEQLTAVATPERTDVGQVVVIETIFLQVFDYAAKPASDRKSALKRVFSEIKVKDRLLLCFAGISNSRRPS